MLPFVNIFGKQVPTYGLCFVIGIFLAVSVAWLLARKKENIESYDVIYAAVFAAVGAIGGAKLLFVIVNLGHIIAGRITLLQAFQGGFVFYGGLIGGIVGLLFYVKKFKLDAWTFFDLFATVLPLGHSIGRVGCFLGGCCYGMKYDGPLHVIYPESIGNTPVGVPLFPVQLVEAALLVLLFVVLVIIYKKNPKPATQVLTYGFVYSLMRFVLEFLRGDKERGFLLGMSTSQLISLLFAFALIAILIIRNKKSKE